MKLEIKMTTLAVLTWFGAQASATCYVSGPMYKASYLEHNHTVNLLLDLSDKPSNQDGVAHFGKIAMKINTKLDPKKAEGSAFSDMTCDSSGQCVLTGIGVADPAKLRVSFGTVNEKGADGTVVIKDSVHLHASKGEFYVDEPGEEGPLFGVGISDVDQDVTLIKSDDSKECVGDAEDAQTNASGSATTDDHKTGSDSKSFE
jgi:hypothetical protein